MTSHSSIFYLVHVFLKSFRFILVSPITYLKHSMASYGVSTVQQPFYWHDGSCCYRMGHVMNNVSISLRLNLLDLYITT